MSREEYVEGVWKRMLQETLEFVSKEKPSEKAIDDRSKPSDNNGWNCKVVCTMCGEPVVSAQDGMLSWWRWGNMIVHAGVVHHGSVGNGWCMRNAEHFPRMLAKVLEGSSDLLGFVGDPHTALLCDMHLARLQSRGVEEIKKDYDFAAWIGGSAARLKCSAEASIRNFPSKCAPLNHRRP
jgi:hypothetical protein